MNFEELQLAGLSFEPHGFWEDPRFVNNNRSGPADFQLKSSGPCLDRGIALPVPADYWGTARPLGARHDIGVFESEFITPPVHDCTFESGTFHYTVVISIAQDEDDAEQETADGHVVLKNGDLEMVVDTNQQIVGLRFNRLFIPQGADITDAYIQFTTDEINLENTTLAIHVEYSEHSFPFADTPFNISSRLLTNASVD